MRTIFKLRKQEDLSIVFAALDSSGGFLEEVKRDSNNWLIITANFNSTKPGTLEEQNTEVLKNIKALRELVSLLNRKP